MSLTSQVINAKPTKVSAICCQMSLLSISHLACNILDIRQKSVKTGHVQSEYRIHAIRIQSHEASEVYYRSSKVTTSVIKTRDIYRYHMVYVHFP